MSDYAKYTSENDLLSIMQNRWWASSRAYTGTSGSDYHETKLMMCGIPSDYYKRPNRPNPFAIVEFPNTTFDSYHRQRCNVSIRMHVFLLRDKSASSSLTNYYGNGYFAPSDSLNDMTIYERSDGWFHEFIDELQHFANGLAPNPSSGFDNKQYWFDNSSGVSITRKKEAVGGEEHGLYISTYEFNIKTIRGVLATGTARS